MHSAATNGANSTAPFLTLAMQTARQRVFISSSYFVPDQPLRAALLEAAARGVDVRVLTAGSRTDVRLARFAGRNSYGELLRGGVRIFEYQPTMMHAKTFVIDSRWSSIGSLNLDRRSMALNDEISVLVFDRRVAATMDSVFFADLSNAHELTLAEFERRGARARVLELLSTILSRLL
jgi:cardiolipin synthase